MAYTEKQIEKFNRQKYITELEKISKNLFRMLRDTTVTSKDFVLKFEQLKKRFDARSAIHLDSEYHQQLKDYVNRLYGSTCLHEAFTEKMLDDIRDAEMSNLNRLQKLKNGASYKKDKHKAKHQHEDWG